MSSKLFSFFYFCRVFIAVASDTCYWIDGTEAANRFACFDSNKNGASMCCDEASSPFFSSCTGGICAYTYASGVQGLYDDGLSFWRDSCTDPTWRDPACVKMASYVTGSQVRLSKCADGSLCPRNTNDLNTTCCENHLGEFLKSAQTTNSASPTSTSILARSTSLQHDSPSSSTTNHEVTTSTSLSQSSQSSTKSSEGTTSSSSLSQSSQDGGNGLNKASEVATIIGSVIGALALLLMVVFGINSWKKRHSPQQPIAMVQNSQP